MLVSVHYSNRPSAYLCIRYFYYNELITEVLSRENCMKFSIYITFYKEGQRFSVTIFKIVYQLFSHQNPISIPEIGEKN